MVTLSRDGTGDWRLSFSLDEPLPEWTPAPEWAAGLDWGVAQWMTAGNGRQWEAPKALAQWAERIAKVQKRLARQVKGSRRRHRTKLRLAKLYRKVRHNPKGLGRTS